MPLQSFPYIKRLTIHTHSILLEKLLLAILFFLSYYRDCGWLEDVASSVTIYENKCSFIGSLVHVLMDEMDHDYV